MAIFLLQRVALLLTFLLPLESRAFEFLCGNAFKEVCEFSYDEYGFNYNPKGIRNYWFVKTDLLDGFFETQLPETPFVLVTHNADHGVTDSYLPQLENENLLHWYGQNVCTTHEKLSSIPIGICNFADHSALQRVKSKNNPKSILVYANYSIFTNPTERKKCKRATRVRITSPKPFEDFLDDVSRSYFVLSPNGNGIDTHRTWEALYLGAIPIVTKSINILHYKNFPILIIDSWEDYKNLSLSPELHKELWGDFDLSKLTVLDFVSPYHITEE